MIETLHFAQMLVGIVAINVLDVIPLDDGRALGVLLVGYVFQGVSALLCASLEDFGAHR